MEQTPSPIEQAEAALSLAVRAATTWNDSCEQAATRLAELLARLGSSRGDIRRRLCQHGVTGSGAAQLASGAIKALRHREKAREQAKFAGASPVCSYCAEPLAPLSHFCPKCSAPASALVTMDPMGLIYTEGWAYRRAVDKPRLMALVGMWLIFGLPLAVAAVFFWIVLRPMELFSSRVEWGHFSLGDLALCLGAFFVVFAPVILGVAILWKVTARYVRSRRTPTE
ncbi:MAG: hypothetical protein WCK05_16460 [Planctomycetota bacterium]